MVPQSEHDDDCERERENFGDSVLENMTLCVGEPDEDREFEHVLDFDDEKERVVFLARDGVVLGEMLREGVCAQLGDNEGVVVSVALKVVSVGVRVRDREAIKLIVCESDLLEE